MNDGKQQRQDYSENNEKEIASRTVQIQSKRIYLDVKQNWRGRFLKVAEVGANGYKNRIIMSMSSTPEFKTHLIEFSKHFKQLVADSTAGASGDEKVSVMKTATFNKDNRRYFLDFKENQRGKYLRITLQTSPYGMRSSVTLPAEGIEEMKDKLIDLIEECGTDDMDGGGKQLPEAKSMRSDNKMFYFDFGANRRGSYLRLSEVRPNYRSAITLPLKSLKELRDYIAEFAEFAENNADSEPASANNND